MKAKLTIEKIEITGESISDRAELAERHLSQILEKDFPGRTFGKKAFIRGWRGKLAGQHTGCCPYVDHRTYHGAITFSRAYIRRWLAGYEACEKYLNTVHFSRGTWPEA